VIGPRLLLLLLFIVLLSGCNADPTELVRPEEAEKLSITSSTSFDPANTGRIIGQLRWSGRLPDVLPISYAVPKMDGSGFDTQTTPNPNRPQINATTRAIGGAVVFLRNVDPASARPWDLPPVSVAIGNQQITVTQGGHNGRVGFVRRGDSVTMVSIEPTFHILRGRGDGFFSVVFPSPNAPVTRTLTHTGRIELSSGTGLSWMRADLFVSDHPYYALTDSDGRFTFDRVPVGKTELIVWLPNWEAGRPIREPESSIIARQTYAPPFERLTPLTISRGQVTELDVSLP
jgi:hypothetical protein